jgi:hypothetical protein
MSHSLVVVGRFHASAWRLRAYVLLEYLEVAINIPRAVQSFYITVRAAAPLGKLLAQP